MKTGISVFLTAAILWGCLEAEDTSPKERWEYCRVQASLGASVSEGKVVSTAWICVMTETGCKDETVSIEQPASVKGTRRPVTYEAADFAMAKTVARLGSEGWEMTGVTRSKSESWVTLYFKRRLR